MGCASLKEDHSKRAATSSEITVRASNTSGLRPLSSSAACQRMLLQRSVQGHSLAGLAKDSLGGEEDPFTRVKTWQNSGYCTLIFASRGISGARV